MDPPGVKGCICYKEPWPQPADVPDWRKDPPICGHHCDVIIQYVSMSHYERMVTLRRHFEARNHELGLPVYSDSHRQVLRDKADLIRENVRTIAALRNSDILAIIKAYLEHPLRGLGKIPVKPKLEGLEGVRTWVIGDEWMLSPIADFAGEPARVESGGKVWVMPTFEEAKRKWSWRHPFGRH